MPSSRRGFPLWVHATVVLRGSAGSRLTSATVQDAFARCLAQHAIELRPADTPAWAVGDVFQRQIEQHGAVGERYPPTMPEETRLRDAICQFRVDRLHHLDRVRPDIEPGAGFGMIVARHPLQAGDFDAIEQRQSPRHHAAGDAGADDDAAHQTPPVSCEAITAISPPPSGP